MKKVHFLLFIALLIPVYAVSFEDSKKIDGKAYNLPSAHVTDSALLYLVEQYYDPARIDPKDMFQAALDALQSEVAEFKYQNGSPEGLVTIHVIDKTFTIGTANLKSPWHVSRALKRVYRFVYENLPKGTYDFYQLEMAVVNGLLGVLDPHSNVLEPEEYDELRTKIRGEFGGLGVQITTDRRPPCNGTLSVVEVFEKTPAASAGLKPGDQIIRIDGTSTANITTAEAARRMRGKPGSAIKLTVKKRAGNTDIFEIVRGNIPIKSVDFEMLDGMVGYISLTGFQKNSPEEFAHALFELRREGMKGLILDMRGNPGGDLIVATELADKFISSGTLVAATDKSGQQHDIASARFEDTEPLYPLVVLIDRNSASAAELLAGSLRHHRRALLVGETTFGKGSVQTIQNLPKGGGVKMTSAQYLIPGGISIQSVGVTPDVEFTYRSVSKKELVLEDDYGRFSEADLDKHLDQHGHRSRNDRGAMVREMVYVPGERRAADRKRLERCFIDEPKWQPFMARYQKEFARRLVATATGTTSEELLITAREMAADDSRQNDGQLQAAFKRLGVDWSEPGDSAEKAKIEGAVEARATVLGKAKAGGKLRMRVTVKNRSKKSIYRLRGVTESDNPALKNYEFAFGKLAPGASKSWTTEIDLPELTIARVDPVKIKFHGDAGPLPGDVEVDVALAGKKQPRFAYGWHFEDLNNHNGSIEPGEDVLLTFDIANVGDTGTRDAELRLAGGAGVDVEGGRIPLQRLKPGARRSVQIKFKVADDYSKDEAPLTVGVEDWTKSPMSYSYSLLRREIKLPVSASGPIVDDAFGSVTLGTSSPVRLLQSPSSEARVVALVSPGTNMGIDGKSGDFFRVRLSNGKHAWVPTKLAGAPVGKPATAKERSLSLYEPPSITINKGRQQKVSREEITIEGVAEHNERVRDVMVFLGKRKLLYLPNPTEEAPGRLAFSLPVKLAEGMNRVTIVARHDDDITTVETLLLRREKIVEQKKEL